MEKIERENIQGMLLYGYKYLPFAKYLFLSMSDAGAVKTWLKQAQFQNASASPKEKCLNIAFTASGLEKMGLPVNEENGFSRAFIEGMDTEHRNRILGDYDDNASKHWDWGSKNDDQLHAVLMLFAQDQPTLDQFYLEQKSLFEPAGLREASTAIDSAYLVDGKEHFGFKDGINQPVIRGIGRQSTKDNYVNAGEFILGYPNEYDKIPHSPLLRKDDFDFGKNGSYMVFRQLEQNVSLFWNTVCDFFGGMDKGKAQGIELAAKMVGRWPNGNQLMEEASKKIARKDLNNFSFYKDDPLGTKCPLGSHIRRTNPRDSLSSNAKKSALSAATDAANKHRILRRGRPYGPPIDPSMSIDKIFEKMDTAQGVRGLNFICFNTDIDRQFEFIQHTWSNNIKFHNLYNDVDPIIGVQNGGKDEQGNYQMSPTQFIVQAHPVRKRYKNIPPFIKVKGGSYLFLPSLPAIEYLSQPSSHKS